MSLAFVLDVCKNGDNPLPFMGIWMKVMQFSITEHVKDGDKLKMCFQTYVAPFC